MKPRAVGFPYCVELMPAVFPFDNYRTLSYGLGQLVKIYQATSDSPTVMERAPAELVEKWSLCVTSFVLPYRPIRSGQAWQTTCCGKCSNFQLT